MSSIPVWYGVVSLVVPAGTGLLGYLLSGRNDEARDRRTMEREQAARQLERDVTRDVWAQAFQRDLLLDLQDQLQALVRVTAKQIMEDERALAADGHLSQLPPGLSDEDFAIGVSVNRLIARILDDDLRRAANEFHDSTRARRWGWMRFSPVSATWTTSRLDYRRTAPSL
ncbi:MAG: hypothetical protein M3Y91_16240 [Actinomycetota bacterium]|nr:hypothetical protein [Actinomycetota bacterium]